MEQRQNRIPTSLQNWKEKKRNPFTSMQ